MKSVNRTCAITGVFLGTHGPAVHLVGDSKKPDQHLSPEVCNSLINVIGRTMIVENGLYNQSRGTLDIEGIKDGSLGNVDEISRAIYRGFRTHQRVMRFLMENFKVPVETFSLWQQELAEESKTTVAKTKSGGRRAMHFH
ncbi:MAG TPA: hypothetical protein PK295_03940 [Candidatus Magasanikbacteria bacterium]|nr:hypothetical protein [Candidatus Magasanikbacteria bacterium]